MYELNNNGDEQKIFSVNVQTLRPQVLTCILNLNHKQKLTVEYGNYQNY